MKIRRIVVAFRARPYPLAIGKVDLPDGIANHPSIRRGELAWRKRWSSASPTVDVGKAYLDAIAERDRLRERFEPNFEPDGVVFLGRPIAGQCNFTFVGPRNVGGRVTGISVHPTDPDTLWVATADGGVWRSRDAGKSWTPLFDNEDTLSIGAVAVAPSNPQRVYVGTGEANGNYDELPGTGVYRSDDGGDTWRRILAVGAFARRISTIWVDPEDANRVLVGSPDVGIHRTINGGTDWDRVLDTGVWEIVGRYGAGNTGTIYCSTSGRRDLIRRSSNFGDSWDTLMPGLQPPTNYVCDRTAVALSPSHPRTLYARANIRRALADGSWEHTQRVLRSDDSAQNWNAGVDDGVGNLGGYANAVAVKGNDRDVVYGASVWVARSANGGGSFALVGRATGIDYNGERYSGPVDVHADIHSLVFAPRIAPTRLYVGTDGGIYVSHFGETGKVDGDAFVKRNHGLNATQFGHLGVAETAASMLGGGTQDNGTPRTLGGLTWRIVFGGDGGIFEVNPRDASECYFQYLTGDLRRSVDGGRNQSSFNSGLSIATEDTGWLEVPFAFDPQDPSIKYTGTSRVYRSVGTAAWTPISNVLTEAASDTDWNPLSVVTVDPSNSSVLWVGSENGRVFRASAPNAESWVERTGAAFPTTWVTDIKVHPTVSSEIYVVINGWRATNRIFFSDNDGADWRDISSGLPNTGVSCFAIDPYDAMRQTLYAGTDIGLFRTTDRGAKWAPFDNGLPPSSVAGIHIHQGASLLRVATHGRGVWEIPIGPLAPLGCADVQLYVRSSQLDLGWGITPSGVPDPDRPGELLYWYESPDIKVDAQPDQTWSHVNSTGTTVTVTADKLDGVVFDSELVHNFPRRGRRNSVYVQIHNRGPFALANVKARVFSADASGGLPAVPSGFFAGFDTWASTAGAWRAVAATQEIAELAPATPKVLRFDWDVPPDAAEHSCLLLLVTAPTDPITAVGTSIDAAVPTDRHVALLNVHVVDSDIIGSPGGTDPTQLTENNAPVPQPVVLQLHNTHDEDRSYTLRIEGSSTGPTRAGLLLPSAWIDRAKVHDGCVCELPHDVRKLATKLDGIDHGRWIRLDGRATLVDGIVIPPKGSIPVALAAAPAPGAWIGREQRVRLLQLDGKHLVGGSTIVLRTGPERHARPRASLVKIALTELKLRGKGARCDLSAELLLGQQRRHRAVRVDVDGPATLFEGYLVDEDGLDLRLRRADAGAARSDRPQGRLILFGPLAAHARRIHVVDGPGFTARVSIDVA